jgi:hypothetical protein
MRCGEVGVYSILVGQWAHEGRLLKHPSATVDSSIQARNPIPVDIADAIFRKSSKCRKMDTLANRMREYVWNKLKTTKISPFRNARRELGNSIMNPYQSSADWVIPLGQWNKTRAMEPMCKVHPSYQHTVNNMPHQGFQSTSFNSPLHRINYACPHGWLVIFGLADIRRILGRWAGEKEFLEIVTSV